MVEFSFERKSLYQGVWDRGGFAIECHVLDTEERLITQDSAGRLFLCADAAPGKLEATLKDLVSKIDSLYDGSDTPESRRRKYMDIVEMGEVLKGPIEFISTHGECAHGYSVEQIVTMAQIISYAFEQGLLSEEQWFIGVHVSTLYDAWIMYGLVNIVDEACGYPRGKVR